MPLLLYTPVKKNTSNQQLLSKAQADVDSLMFSLHDPRLFKTTIVAIYWGKYEQDMLDLEWIWVQHVDIGWIKYYIRK